MVVHPSVPARTVPEFIAYAKANPGKVKMASTGNGSSPHVTGELFKMMTGVDVVLVHYRRRRPGAQSDDRGPGRDDVRADVGGDRAHPQRQARALAVTTAARSQALPDVPTLADSVPGYEASAVTGIGVPRDTPAEIIGRLNQAINAGLRRSQHEGARLADTGGRVAGLARRLWPCSPRDRDMFRPKVWPRTALCQLLGHRPECTN